MIAPLDDSDDGPREQWRRILTACFARRYRPDDAISALNELHKLHRISGLEVSTLLLRCGDHVDVGPDPLLAGYINVLLSKSIIQPCDLLKSLLQLSPSYRNSSSPGITLTQAAREAILTYVSTLYASADRPSNVAETAATFRALLSWLEACNVSEHMLSVSVDGFLTLDKIAMAGDFERVGSIMLQLLQNPNARKHLGQAIPDSAKPRISAIIHTFASTIAPLAQSNVAQQLQYAVKFPPFLTLDSGGVPNLTAAEIHAEVLDVPRSLSRSGMYIYLNAALSGRPRINDVHLLATLQARYPVVEQSIGSLIIAAFDALTNALQRSESEHLVLCHRSFIVNKVPLLIAGILRRAMYSSRMAEQGIQLVLSTIGTHPFPPLTSSNSETNATIRETREEFVRACQLHNLMSEGSVTSASGQGSKPASAEKLQKHTIVRQLQGNIQKAEEYVNELGAMNGNAGAVTTAFAETIRQATLAKDTSTIKVMCSVLCKKLPFVDIMLHYIQLSELLKPIGSFLNDWTHDEDQSELQPAYEDFAIILLFTLAIVHRYDVQFTEMDDFPLDSFMIKIQTEKFNSRQVSSLTQEDQMIISKWSKGLFSVDEKGESTGIRDDIMSGCTPQQFFLLVPTLFEQIVNACMAKKLSPNTLRGGLEFLLEPFLLPSLIAGMGWLANHVWSTPNHTDIVMLMLAKLVKPSSISGEAASMHQTILGIMYKDLRHGLTGVERRAPGRKDVAALAASLKQFADSQYEFDATDDEIKTWTSSTADSLPAAVTNIFNNLTSWATQSDLNPTPPSYTHRTLDAALSRCSASTILDLLAAEVSEQSSVGFAAPALEVAGAIITAPSLLPEFDEPLLPDAPDVGLGLSAVLKLRLADANGLMHAEAGVTEALVRLGRIVDAFDAVPRAALVDIEISAEDARAMDEAISAIPAEAAMEEMQVTSEEMPDLTAGMDLGLEGDMFGGSMDMGLATDGQVNPEDDIFAGIDLGIMGDDDFAF